MVWLLLPASLFILILIIIVVIVVVVIIIIIIIFVVVVIVTIIPQLAPELIVNWRRTFVRMSVKAPRSRIMAGMRAIGVQSSTPGQR